MADKHKIVVLTSGNGSNFQAIIDNCKHVKVTEMITDNPSALSLTRASKANIPSLILVQPEQQAREAYCEMLAKLISHLDPKLIVLAGFMKILTPNFFDYFDENQIVNIHPSLLPKHKGTNTHQRVLDAGDEEHGITIHYVTEELDSGPVLWQSSYFVEPEDTAETLKEKGHKLEHKWYPWVIDHIVTGDL